MTIFTTTHVLLKKQVLIAFPKNYRKKSSTKAHSQILISQWSIKLRGYHKIGISMIFGSQLTQRKDTINHNRLTRSKNERSN